jgi:hypothetical protein
MIPSSRRRPGSSCSREEAQGWIPAFAGMTDYPRRSSSRKSITAAFAREM